MTDSPNVTGTDPGASLPVRLARARRDLAPGTTVPWSGTEVADARNSVGEQRWDDVLCGAGLHNTGQGLRVLATLPDTVDAGMRVLFVGLNPSVRSADAGVGFVTPGNRFWPAALAAGVVSHDRDPFAVLRDDAVGMTDVAKRATRRADELLPDEFVSGMARIERMVRWLEPERVCFVGLTGWRTAVDKKANAGPIDAGIGDRPAYLMPSTSGLNAHSQLPDFVAHLQALHQLSA